MEVKREREQEGVWQDGEEKEENDIRKFRTYIYIYSRFLEC